MSLRIYNNSNPARLQNSSCYINALSSDSNRSGSNKFLDKSVSFIDSSVPNNRLYANQRGEVVLAEKTLGEIAGERILYPLIEKVRSLTSNLSSLFSMVQVPIHWPSFPPGASAQVLPAKSDSSFDSFASSDNCFSQARVEALLVEIVKEGLNEKKTASKVDHFFDFVLPNYNKISWSHLDTAIIGQLRDSNGGSLFLAAVEIGDKDCVVEFGDILKDTEARHATDVSGRNGLHIAAKKGHDHLISYLTNIIPVDSKDKEGLTALHWAIHEGEAKTVGALIENGASLIDPWINNGSIIYPLEMAVASGSIEVLKTILEKDRLKQIDLGQSIPNFGTILHVAIHSDQRRMLEYLLKDCHKETKSLVDLKDFKGRTPLQLAAFLGDLTAIYLLDEQHVDLDKGVDEEGGTALHYAVRGEHPEVITLLHRLGANLSANLLINGRSFTAQALLDGRTGGKAEECKALLKKLSKLDKIDKTRPPNFYYRPPLNLVFQGGGPKGLAYVGAIRQLEKEKLLSEVKRVAGTSAGAITASLFSVGYDSASLEPLLARDFSDFLDAQGSFEAGLLKAVKNESWLQGIKAVIEEYWEGWQTVLYPTKSAKNLYNRLSQMTGLCSGEKLRDWTEDLIHKKTGIAHCTFKELHELSIKNPQKYKDLHVFATRLDGKNEPEIVRFSYGESGGKWDNLIISDAVRASASIPGAFEPHTLHFKDSTGRYPTPQHGKFGDGGLLKNFGIDAFDDNKYQEDRYNRGEKTNRRTLGLSFNETTALDTQKIRDIKSPKDLIGAIFSTYFHAEEILNREKSHNKDRMIPIPITDVGLMEFEANDIKKAKMIRSGEGAVSFFLLPSK